MLEIMMRALEALSARDDRLTSEWKTAQQRFEEAKSAECRARSRMQDNDEVRQKIAEFVKALETEGQP